MAQEAAPKFLYKPLSGHTTSLRLLLIEKGHYHDSIVCTLQEHALEAVAQRYETISYAWGDVSIHSSIRLNELTVYIPVAAAAALRRVRREGHDRLCFLDAVCINQGDDNERAAQVAVMQKIYASSCGNLVYLDEEDTSTLEASHSIWELLHEIKAETDDYANIWDVVADANGRNARHAATGYRRRPHLTAIERLFCRPWFRRLWVTLETLAAPSNTCYCGNFSIPLLELLRVSAWMHYKSFYSTIYLNEYDARCPHSINNRLWTWWVALEAGASHFSRQCGGLISFFQIMRFGCSRETSKERDRVYALQQLQQLQARSVSVYIAPDYQRPLQDVMCDAARACFVDTDGRVDLSALHHVHHASRAEVENGTWPSWTPRWTEYYNDPGTLEADFSPLGQASIDAASYPGGSGKVLHVKGIVVGSVITRTPTLSDDIFQDAGRLRHWLASTRNVDGSDVTNSIEGLIEHLKDGYVPRIGVTELDPDYTPHTILYHKLWLYAIERCVFDIDTGLLGLGQGFLRPGDLVVAVRGSPWPLVLHERPSGRFRFVGEAYVDGAMYGEAAQDGDGELHPLREFIIE